MNNRLYKVLENNLMHSKYPMHMPGHKRNFYSINYENYDFTEIDGLDNLQNPEECIKTSLTAISKVFKSDESLILVNGSTVGLLASIMGIANPNDTIVVARNCHQSVTNAINMAKCNHSFIYPQYNNGIVTGFDAKQIETAITSNNNVKALVITSPTYEGVVLDIKSISKITKKYNVTLIIDEAHGAYFIDKNLPKSAIECGANVVIQSLHKTLPCPTQTAILHFNSTCTHINNIKKYLLMLQTTSPSYFFMYTIDKFIAEFEKGKFNTMFDNHYTRIQNFRNKCLELKSLGVLELVCDDFKDTNNIFDLDIYKLTFLVNTNNGVEISNILRNNFNIELEMATDNHFIAMTSIADTDEIFDCFYCALVKISEQFKHLSVATKNDFVEHYYPRPNGKKFCDVNTENVKLVDLQDCIGKICAKNITPYPPCVPLVFMGETFTTKDVENIFLLMHSGVNVLGVVDNKVAIENL